MRVPYLDLQAQYRLLQAELRRELDRVLASGAFVLGPELEAFEREFAAFCGSGFAVGVNSGTSALHLALLAAGVGPGDEVITTPMTFVATAAAVEYAGARPRFVDIEPTRQTLDPRLLETALSSRTRAILPVHLHGLPADMGPILEFAQRHGLAVVEDAAQAHGARYGAASAGTLGRFGCFSFYPGKNLGAYGEAGAVVGADAEDAARLRRLRNWGSSERYVHQERGFNYRLDAIQCAILRVKLRHLATWNHRRQEIAGRYRQRLARFPDILPAEVPDVRPVHHVFAVRVPLPHRDEVARALERQGITCLVHYPIPLHLQPAYRDLGYRRGDFPEAERMAAETLSLPIYPEMPDEHADYVASALVDALQAV